jgi:intein/homing endonuclease
MDFWDTFLGSIGGTALAATSVAFLAKKWIGTRVTESVRIQYDKQREEFKKDLQLIVAKSSAEHAMVFEQKLNALKGVYACVSFPVNGTV